jgi:hypothetical protein
VEKLKPFEDLGKPDFRNTIWVRSDGQKLTIEEYYSWAEDVVLHDDVPEEIRSQWNVTRNVWLYSWHVYSFHQVAEMKAFFVLELALKERLDNPKLRALRQHLNAAINQGLLSKDKFIYSKGKDNGMSEQEYLSGLAELICTFRNSHAHEGKMLMPDSLFKLGLCADIINQLFNLGIDAGISEEGLGE